MRTGLPGMDEIWLVEESACFFFSLKGQLVIVLGFAGHTEPVLQPLNSAAIV